MSIHWWEMHPIVPDDSSGQAPHKDARDWMQRATIEIGTIKAENEKLLKFVAAFDVYKMNAGLGGSYASLEKITLARQALEAKR